MGERNGWVNVFHMFIRVCSLPLDDPSFTFDLLFQFQGPGITGLSCFTQSLGHFFTVLSLPLFSPTLSVHKVFSELLDFLKNESA